MVKRVGSVILSVCLSVSMAITTFANEDILYDIEIATNIADEKGLESFDYNLDASDNYSSEDEMLIMQDLETEDIKECQVTSETTDETLDIIEFEDDVETPALYSGDNIRNRIAQIANAEEGYQEEGNNINKYASELGMRNGEAWCATFAGWCHWKAGASSIDYPIGNASTTGCVRWFQKSENAYWHNEVNYLWSYNGISSGGQREYYRPQPGDFVAIETDGGLSNGPDHTGLVVAFDGNSITTMEGNKKDRVTKVKYSFETLSEYGGSASIVGFGEPAYGAYVDNSLPVGCVDVVDDGYGQIHVAGWAFDPDAPSSSIEVHVYVGGPAGDSNAIGRSFVANGVREDVNNVYGISGKHGFDCTFETSKRGNQPIYIYAIDSDDANSNTCICEGEYVYINAEKRPVVINSNKKDILLNVGESTTVQLTFSGDGIYTFKMSGGDTLSYVDVYISEIDYSKGIMILNFKGLKPRKLSDFTIFAVDSNNQNLCQKVIPITILQPVTNIGLNKQSTEIVLGGSETLVATVNPANASNRNLIWKSSNESVATVKNGKVEAKGIGNATITAKSCDGSGKSASCTVKVIPIAVQKITLNKTYEEMTIGASASLSVTVTPTNATNKNIIWTSNNTDIVSVNNGKLSAKGIGTAYITATSEENSSIKAICTVLVKPIYVQNITLNKVIDEYDCP